VHANRNFSGVHWSKGTVNTRNSIGSNNLHLGEESVHKKVQEPAKQLIPHENGNVQVTKDHSTIVLPWVVPNFGDREDHGNGIESHNHDEEFPIVSSSETSEFEQEGT